MAALDASDLRARVRGNVVTPEDEGYDAARTVYNAMIRRKPAAVVRVTDDADVMATVRFAREGGHPLAVRGGGHSVPGFGTCDDGIVVDLGSLRSVRVGPNARTVRVGGGALLGDVDHATNAFGLAVPAGFISTTGVGGLTLGGGIGYLSRRLGLTADNLLSADVITADGNRVTVSADEHPDLFWALHGGGGNFGIVTSFEFRLHPVDQIVGGPIFFGLDAAADVLDFYRRHFPAAPRELGGFFGFIVAPPLPFIPEERHGEPLCVLVVCWSGDPAEADRMLEPVRGAGPVVAEHVGSMPYPALQSAFDGLLPRGLRHYWKADFVRDLSDEALAAHLKHGPKVPNVNSAMHIYLMDGAVQDVGPEETAFARRDARFVVNIAGVWRDEADDDSNIGWVRDYYDAVHPHSGFEGGYTNFMAGDDERRVRANYGESYDRLAKIKRAWDPDNAFRLNQNVAPAG